MNCGRLGDSAWAEALVQKEAASWSMQITVISSLVAALSSVFYGAWSDRVGRGPVLALSFYSDYLCYFGFLLIISSPAVPLSLNYVSYTLAGLLGFWPTYMEAGVAAMSDACVRNDLQTIQMVLMNLLSVWCLSVAALRACELPLTFLQYAGEAVGGLLTGFIAAAVGSDSWLMAVGLLGLSLEFLLVFRFIPAGHPLRTRLACLKAERQKLRAETKPTQALLLAVHQQLEQTRTELTKFEVEARRSKKVRASWATEAWRDFVRLQKDAVRTYFQVSVVI